MEERVNHSVLDIINALRAARSPKKNKSRKRAASVEPEKPLVERTNPPTDEAEADDLEDSAEADDPYRVRTVERLTRVSHDEYNTSSRCALHPCYTFDLQRLEQVSRHAYWNPKVQAPQQYYTQDTAPLIDALVLTCGVGGLEGVARRAATQIPYENLLVVENGDTTRIIESICGDPAMSQSVQRAAEQYLFALMAVENATQHVPQHLREVLKMSGLDGSATV